ncbi:hypothetical protein [Bradyrhizobium sp.]|uniref:hypothetical protein n=1 Tax=Bradyrhizobium sp. TaxID=376 RepID=UPI003C746680
MTPHEKMVEEVVMNELARDMDLMPLVLAGHVKATRVMMYRMQWRAYALGITDKLEFDVWHAEKHRA